MPKKNVIFTIPRLDDDEEVHTFERRDGKWLVDDEEMVSEWDVELQALANAYADLANADEADDEDDEDE